MDKPEILGQILEATRTFRPIDEPQGAALPAKTSEAARAGEYELFKTTAHFDTTAKHAEWLSGETPEVKRLAPRSAG